MRSTRVEILGRADTSQGRDTNKGTNNTSDISSLPSSEDNSNDKEAVFNMMVTRVVNESVFPKKQFIILEAELDVHGKLASKCLSALRLDRSKWYVVKEMIRKRLNRRRNNAQLSMRRSFHRYLDIHGVDSINLDEVLEGRKNKKAFHWFLDHIASVVVGASLVEQNKYVKLPSDWLSPSLEAFSLLLLENYYEMVQSQAMKDERVCKPKWTSDGRGKKKNQGWDQDGIRRYNILVEQVRVDRASFKREEEYYLQEKQQERMALENEKLKRKEMNAGGGHILYLEIAKDDFSSDEE